MNSVTMCDGCVAVLGGGKITVTIDADRHSESFCRVQVAFFKKPLRLACRLGRCFCRPQSAEVATGDPHPRRAQNLLAVCIFDGLACQKCFCVTLDKSNRTEDEQVYEIGGITYAKNDKRNGG